MKILIVNDDGIEAEGIKLMAEWASKLGEITVIAPKTEQSGKAHGINFTSPMEIKKTTFPHAKEAYIVDSTPADCVRYGVIGLKQGYDLILSGINKGLNIGQDIIYSGTAGAIFEAAHIGQHALAVSTTVDGLQVTAEHLDRIYDFVVRNDLLSYNPIYNINVPSEVHGIRTTRQGQAFFSDDFYPIGNDMYIQKGHCVPEPDIDNETYDSVAVDHGIISVTPMRINMDDLDVYQKIATIIEK